MTAVGKAKVELIDSDDEDESHTTMHTSRAATRCCMHWHTLASLAQARLAPLLTARCTLVSALSQAAILSMLSPEARAALSQHQQSAQAAQREQSLDEDFGMSQFWYTPAFSSLVAHEALTLGGSRQSDQPVTIVCIACPSIFQQLHPHRSSLTRVWLLEYDARFARYSPFFVHYDLNQPLHGLPPHLVHSADCVIVDPPYLNIQTLSLAMQTVQQMARTEPAPRLILNTGAVLRERIERLWDMRPVREKPEHRVRIMNPFLCYTNYDAKQLGGWENEEQDEDTGCGTDRAKSDHAES